MLPTPRAGWVHSVQFVEHDNGLYWAPAEKWDGIDHFTLSNQQAPSDLEVGDRRLVQVTGVSGSRGHVTMFHQGGEDQLRPSGSRVVRIRDRSQDGYSVGALDSFPFIDSVRIYGKVPATVLRVPIDVVVPMDGFAVSDVSHYRWPGEDDTIQAFVKQGQSTARSVSFSYEFPIDEPAPVTGKADIRVRYDSGVLLGNIESYHTERPDLDEIVEAEVDPGKADNIGWWGAFDDRIKLEETPPISGTVEVQITNADDPICGEIVTQPADLPVVGDVVEAYVPKGSGKTYARASQFGGNIKIPTGTEQVGVAEIEITKVDEALEGRILSYRGSPEEDDVLEAEVSRGTSPVKGTVHPMQSDIIIEENVLASGRVDVRITDASRPLRGVVESYRELLPQRGERVRATIESGITLSTARPYHGEYIVYLPDADDYDGPAIVEIHEIEDRISGEIVEEIDVGQKRADDRKKSPFQSKNSAWNITRQKH